MSAISKPYPTETSLIPPSLQCLLLGGEPKPAEIELPDFVDHIAAWTHDKLPSQSYHDDKKLFAAYQDLFKREAANIISVEASGELSSKALQGDGRSSSFKLARESFPKTKLHECIEQKVWRVLRSDFFAKMKSLTKIECGSDSKTALPFQENQRKSIKQVDRKLILKLSHTKYVTKEGEEIDADSPAQVKLTNMTDGLEKMFAQANHCKNVQCYSYRELCLILQDVYPAAMLLETPYTYRKDLKEIHVYRIGVPEQSLQAFTECILELMEGSDVTVAQGETTTIYTQETSTFYLSITCENVCCTREWSS